FAAAGLSVGEIGVLAAAYPAVWAVGQIATGALSDRGGRKALIVAGMLVQAVAIGAIAVASSFGAWLAASVALGVGTALVYPTLLAAVGEGSPPPGRGSAVGGDLRCGVPRCGGGRVSPLAGSRLCRRGDRRRSRSRCRRVAVGHPRGRRDDRG